MIAVRKDAVPDDPQDFDFTTGGGLSPSSFQLDDDGDPYNALSNSRVFPVDPGSGYSVSETVPAGWDLASATCSDGSPPSNIDVSESEEVTCTFTNNKRAQIVVVQDTLPDDPQDFDYTAGGGLSPASFQLDDDGDNSNAPFEYADLRQPVARVRVFGLADHTGRMDGGGCDVLRRLICPRTSTFRPERSSPAHSPTSRPRPGRSRWSRTRSRMTRRTSASARAAA